MPGLASNPEDPRLRALAAQLASLRELVEISIDLTPEDPDVLLMPAELEEIGRAIDAVERDARKAEGEK